MDPKDFQSISQAISLRQKMEEVEMRHNPDAKMDSFGTWHKTGGDADAGQFGSPLQKAGNAKESEQSFSYKKPQREKEGSILSVILNRLMHLSDFQDYLLWGFLILLISAFSVLILLLL